MAAIACPWTSIPCGRAPKVSAHGHVPGTMLSSNLSSVKIGNPRMKSLSLGVRGGPGLVETPGLPGDMGGIGVLEKPQLDRSRAKTPTPKVDEGGEMGKSREKRGSGGGERYKVLLLDHEKHTESQVAAVLPKVVPSVTPEEAKRCFHESREKGAGLVTVAVKEHAEFYSQMMIRSGLRSAIEPDGDVL
uniref:Adaptor protein ClpS core domain-containing protein n=1 Tax=Araucaria cunninghamii TaxID=56994 RepID=A0A0D6R3A7_ARACU